MVRYDTWQQRGITRHNEAQRGDSKAPLDFDLRCHVPIVSQRDYNEATAWLARGDNVTHRGTRPYLQLFSERVNQKWGTTARPKRDAYGSGISGVTHTFSSKQSSP